jgi:cytoskeletal protein RodZ
MMRSFVVVLVFVVLNAVAFVAHRAISTSEAAASTRPDSAATAADTLARPIPASQPKPDELAKPPVVAPRTPEAIETAPSNLPDPSVSAHTESATGEPAEVTRSSSPHQTHRQPAAHHRVERTPAHAAKPAHEAPPAVVAKPADQDKPAQDDKPAHAKSDDKLLEMEANPYKQSE